MFLYDNLKFEIEDVLFYGIFQSTIESNHNKEN